MRSTLKQLRAATGKTLRSIIKPLGYTIEGGSHGWLSLCFNPVLKLAGVQLVPRKGKGLGYIECKSTVASAKQAGLTIPKYVAKLWKEEGVVESFIEYLSGVIPLSTCITVLEIGAGTGRFLEPTLALTGFKCDDYSVYETDPDWSDYLSRNYNVKVVKADGCSLAATAPSSQNLILANNVFVYLPVFIAFGYFAEMCRVCAPLGFVVFDCYLDDEVDLATIDFWLAGRKSWPVILPRQAVVAFFKRNGLNLIDGTYQMPCFGGPSRYLVFQKPLD